MRKFIILIVIICGLGILFAVNPESASYMPRCLFHSLTGWNCPACGSQRALHQLLHLHFAKAFTYNPFLLISLPYLGTLILCQWFNENHRFDALKKICHHPILVNIYLLLLLIWWIVRNLFHI